MKEAFWGYFLIALAVIIVIVVMVVQNMTSTSEEDYYLIKEVMESAMVESVDYGTYRLTGEIIISQEKFVENFLRRFAESVSPNKTYKVDFYDIYESPPKASVKVTTSAGAQVVTGQATDFDIITILNGIVETRF